MADKYQVSEVSRNFMESRAEYIKTWHYNMGEYGKDTDTHSCHKGKLKVYFVTDQAKILIIIEKINNEDTDATFYRVYLVSLRHYNYYLLKCIRMFKSS